MSLLKKDHNPFVYRLIFLIVFMADAFFSPFVGLYFDSIGLDGIQKSLLLGLMPFAVFFGDLLFSHFATTYKRGLFLLRLLTFIELTLVVLIAFFPNFIALIFLTVGFSFENNAIFNILSGTCSSAIRKGKTTYSSERIFGSIGYALSLFLGYFLLGALPYRLLFLISASLFFLGAIITFFLYPVQEDEADDDEDPEIKKHGLWSKRSFVLFMVYYVLFLGAINAGGTLLPLYLKQLGMADNLYSLYYSFRVVSEIASILLFPLLMRFMKSHKVSLIVSTSLYLLSLLLMVLVKNVDVLGLSVMLIQGFANGFFLISSVAMLEEIVGSRLITKALTIVAGLTSCLTGLLNLVSSTVYENTSFPVFFFILLLVSVAGTASLFFINEHKKTSPVLAEK
jgi:MFS family permease